MSETSTKHSYVMLERMDRTVRPMSCFRRKHAESWPREVEALPPGARFSGRMSGNFGPKDAYIRKHAPPAGA
jgi:hypothetical protein